LEDNQYKNSGFKTNEYEVLKENTVLEFFEDQRSFFSFVRRSDMEYNEF